MEKESKLKEDIEKPLNILKIGVWRPKIVDGVKTQVWLPSGEEILSRSGILHWKEDLEHLKNQLSVEQLGCCDSFDSRQAKRDSRNLTSLLSVERRKEHNNNRKKFIPMWKFQKKLKILIRMTLLMNFW